MHGVPESKMVKLLSKGFYKGRPKPSESRVLAYNLIHQVNREGAYANIRLPSLLEASHLDERDRGFATELSYGTLRMQGKYDYIIAKHVDREIAKVDPAIIDILRMGFHEIYGMRTPEHASVSQTVDLARFIVGESTGAFVNAILRNALRDGSAPAYTDDAERLSVEFSHPRWIVQAFFDLTKDWDRVERILRSNNEPAIPQLVAWPKRCTVEELLAAGAERLKGTRYGVQADHPPFTYPAIRERRAGVQDRGSQIVSEIFLSTSIGISEGLSWLDMCAGPGGKAAYVYHSLQAHRPQDIFTANEISQHRADLVAQVLPGENVIVGAGQELSDLRKYDRIMVDAPCTGLGALRRRPEARWRRSLQDLKELVVLQRELLDSAVRLLSEGGLISYVTCSPHIAETRLQVADFLFRHKDFEIVDIVQWIPEGYENARLDDGSFQLWTDVDNSDSMFMSIFKRKG